MVMYILIKYQNNVWLNILEEIKNGIYVLKVKIKVTNVKLMKN